MQNINIKKCFTDELGINNFISLEYIPKYICYIEDKPNIKNENEDKPNAENSNKSKHLVILIEIPGTINELNYDLKLVDNNYKLNITGKKMLSKKLKIKNENILSSSIEEGNFSLNILIPHDEEKNIILANEKEITDFSKTKDGYLKITCDLYEKKKQKIIINNDDDDED
jgi:HSP20 family molecular chaperone IbpA